jgi:hypothetical protein
MIKIFLLVLTFGFMMPATDFVELRKQLDRAANDSKVADQFYSRFKDLDEAKADPTLLGFKAISTLILAKHAFNPMTKVSNFKKGKRILESAIARAPKDPQLIFFRYTTQVNVPAMLKYSSNVKEDRLLLINYLKANAKAPKDADLFNRVKKYLTTEKPGSPAEQETLKRL